LARDESSSSLPPRLRTFVEQSVWTFAKTMPEWPHEYIVRERVDEELFERLVAHIRGHGYEGRFYEKPITYYEEAGLVVLDDGCPSGRDDHRQQMPERRHLRTPFGSRHAPLAHGERVRGDYSAANTSPAISAAASSCIAGMAWE
jgi:hypothetical protein